MTGASLSQHIARAERAARTGRQSAMSRYLEEQGACCQGGEGSGARFRYVVVVTAPEFTRGHLTLLGTPTTRRFVRLAPSGRTTRLDDLK